MAQGVRGRWGVENGLHWRLDVQKGEDQSRLRIKHGAKNFSRPRRIAKIMQGGLRLKQQSCGWSRKFLLEVLLA